MASAISSFQCSVWTTRAENSFSKDVTCSWIPCVSIKPFWRSLAVDMLELICFPRSSTWSLHWEKEKHEISMPKMFATNGPELTIQISGHWIFFYLKVKFSSSCFCKAETSPAIRKESNSLFLRSTQSCNKKLCTLMKKTHICRTPKPHLICKQSNALSWTIDIEYFAFGRRLITKNTRIKYAAFYKFNDKYRNCFIFLTWWSRIVAWMAGSRSAADVGDKDVTTELTPKFSILFYIKWH